MTGQGGRIRALVVSWNGAHLLPACLGSLLAQSMAPELHLVVVDNASQDGTTELLRETYPMVEVITSTTNRGFAGGVALGMQDADEELVLLLNNDATLAPQALERMAAVLSAPGNERVGAVTAKILLEGHFREQQDDGTPLPVGGFRQGTTVYVPVPADHPEAVRLVNSTGNLVSRDGAGVDRDWLAVDGTECGGDDVMGFCGGAALLRRAAVEEVGGFDPELFLYYEDTDLSWKLRTAGWSIRYEATAIASHRHAASSDAGSALFRYYNTRNSLVVVGRHAPLTMVLRSLLRQIGGWVAAWRRHESPATRAARGRGILDAVLRTPRTARERRSIRRTKLGSQSSA
ncbi:glycosyltransferase family 2 protein [Actinotalea sp. K2]|uniref:glycosyltransferase family 2 protein n=1 Tax=Actinotalea sp. K2 TaxID=2939438 RepID=UPI002017561E|nr:glycosyltransferase [Actinotalea sp. K2]MCL3862707.1 glycosyltransferase family 2 protein [Actinotalea sp. K2]